MSDTTETARTVLLAIAQGASTFADLAGPGVPAGATKAAAAAVVLVARLMEKRTPEETISLLEELVDEPARRVDLDSIREEVAELVRKRREEDAGR